MSVTFSSGSSTYDGIIVSDRQIVELTGIDTYNSLRFLSPELYVSLTTPEDPMEYCIELIQSVMINENLFPKSIKKLLVISYVNGKPIEAIRPLIDSSLQPTTYKNSFLTSAYFIMGVCIFVIIFVWLIIIFNNSGFSLTPPIEVKSIIY